MCGKGYIVISLEQSSICFWQAKVLTPSIFMAQEPQTPSRQDLRYVKLVSTSDLILFKIDRLENF